MMFYVGSGLTGFLFKLVAIVFISGIIAVPFVPLKIKPAIAGITVFLVGLFTSILAVKCLTGGELEYLVNGGSFFGEIPLRIDGLTAWFILIINFTSITGAVYGSGYLKPAAGQSQLISFHWILFIIFQSSMLAVTLVQHSIAFIVAWEIMSLSSFLLVLFDYTNPKVIKAGVNYLVQMHISVVLLTVGFIWVYLKSGTFDFKGFDTFFGSEVNIWLFLIFFAGFGIKAGFIGFHTWLPQAHPAAPSHISGVMSGVIVKLGIYGIFRVIFSLKADFIILGEIVLTFSLLTSVFGIMNAAVHRDFKKMLAYCTIENIGIIGVGIGIGLIGIGKSDGLLTFLGFSGALLHTLNHSLFKSLLFFSAGSVYRQTHTRDMDKLGGLIRKMPETAVIFLIGAVAIGGIPPLNGFISEFLIYCGILTGMNSAGISQVTLMILAFSGLSLVGGISLLTFSKTFGTIFLGVPRQKIRHEVVEVPFLMLLPQYLIITLMILVAIFPGYLINIMAVIINTNTFPGINFDITSVQHYADIMKNISLVSLILLLITGLVFFIRWSFTRIAEEKSAPTWGCGYVSPNNRMQYTGKSFSKSFGKLLNFLIIEKKGYKEIANAETFPVTRKYRSFYLDFFEERIIDPVILLITRFINLFQFIQNGKIQAYVLYGIIFILTIFLGTIFNLWH